MGGGGSETLEKKYFGSYQTRRKRNHRRDECQNRSRSLFIKRHALTDMRLRGKSLRRISSVECEKLSKPSEAKVDRNLSLKRACGEKSKSLKA
jgi:hypothetical protein